jgi:hypothetical protein
MSSTLWSPYVFLHLDDGSHTSTGSYIPRRYRQRPTHTLLLDSMRQGLMGSECHEGRIGRRKAKKSLFRLIGIIRQLRGRIPGE